MVDSMEEVLVGVAFAPMCVLMVIISTIILIMIPRVRFDGDYFHYNSDHDEAYDDNENPFANHGLFGQPHDHRQESRTTPFQEREDDEDIQTIVTNHGSPAPSQAPATSIQGPITRSRAKKLIHEVNSLLTKFDYNLNENFILPKCSTFVLLRFTHIGGAAGPKETSYIEEETSYAEAEPSHCLLTSVPNSKSHAHQLVKNRYQ
ncbi:hypothetical protein EJB05_46840, partial [Eragrostis curvula]